MTHSSLEQLCNLVNRAEPRRTETGIPRLAMVKGEIPAHKLAAVYEPMINLVVQGSKILTIGEQVLHYNPASYFVMSVDLPATGKVVAASPDKPYMAISLTISAAVVAEMMVNDPKLPVPDEARGFSVCAMNDRLMDAWCRLLQLMDTPQDIPALAPLYERELLYLVLQGPQGWLLQEIASAGSALTRIHKSIQWIRQHYHQTLPVEQLADVAGMSASAFHRHFKHITDLSPLQYQKQMRLLEARRLLLENQQSAGDIAYQVGYESPSQFSREYARFFGLPPRQDALRLKAFS
ncbi:MAG TPA: AraC family transcriptional regulator [Cellvibrio sp.]|nr:AraC family transcriptional regulator [Cellvibrio sp.]